MSLPDKIERLQPDSSYPSFWHAEYGNQVVDLLNALRRLEVVGGKVIWSDTNVKIVFSGSVAASTPSTPTTGSTTFVSSSINCLCRWS